MAAAVQGLLQDGRLALGVRLPAERELASALSVSRTTVTAAYRELRSSGHLTSRRGAGSWTALPNGQRVATSGLWAPTGRSDVIDLGCAALAAPAQLGVAAQEAVTELARYDRGAGYHPAGLPELCDAVARTYAARGLPTRGDQIMITSGTQQALDLLLRLLVGPGQTVLVESPTYANALAAIREHRLRVATSNLDPDTGWDEGMLLSAVRGGDAHLAYLIPEFQNPCGHLMPAPLRERLAAAVHAAGIDLIVDEAFVDLQLGTDDTAPEMPPPVAAFDRHARVLSIGGMSKPYWGGLRIGWIRAAAPVIGRLSALRVAVDMASPVLDQLVALRLLAYRDDVIRDRRMQLTRQRDHLAAALRAHLPEWTFTVPSGGASLWVELDAPVSSALARAAIAHGLIVASGPRFGVDGTLERYMRLPFHLPVDEIDEAVRRLAAARADLDRLHPVDWSTPALVA